MVVYWLTVNDRKYLLADEKRCRAGPPRIFAVEEPASGLPPNQPHPLGLLNKSPEKNTGTDWWTEQNNSSHSIRAIYYTEDEYTQFTMQNRFGREAISGQKGRMKKFTVEYTSVILQMRFSPFSFSSPDQRVNSNFCCCCPDLAFFPSLPAISHT